MDERLEILLKDITRRPPAADIDRLREVAAERGVGLPNDYLEFMSQSDGGDGDVGTTWLEPWPIAQIIEQADRAWQPYDNVFLFAGNGANTIYGFDVGNADEIIEGDWIGLARDEVIRHGRTFRSFLESLASNPS